MEPNEAGPRVVPNEQEELLGGVALVDDVGEGLDLSFLHFLISRLRGRSWCGCRHVIGGSVSAAVSVHTRVGGIGELGRRSTIGEQHVGRAILENLHGARLLRVDLNGVVLVERLTGPLLFDANLELVVSGVRAGSHQDRLMELLQVVFTTQR